MKIGPVIFFIFHYIIKFMLLTVILTGELLADRNGLMLIYILYFFIFLLTIMMKECKFRPIGTPIPILTVHSFRSERYAYSGLNGTASL